MVKTTWKYGMGSRSFPPGLDPPFFLQELTLGTVPVSAGVVRYHLCAAVSALVHVAALEEVLGAGATAASGVNELPNEIVEEGGP
jgi:hypothetical protein